MEPDTLYWIAAQLIAAAAIWGGIRADIRAMHARIQDVERTADRAHVRIDDMMRRRSDGQA